MTNDDATAAYINTALLPMLSALKEPMWPAGPPYLDAVVAWEVLNEPEGISRYWRLYKVRNSWPGWLMDRCSLIVCSVFLCKPASERFIWLFGVGGPISDASTGERTHCISYFYSYCLCWQPNVLQCIACCWFFSVILTVCERMLGMAATSSKQQLAYMALPVPLKGYCRVICEQLVWRQARRQPCRVATCCHRPTCTT